VSWYKHSLRETTLTERSQQFVEDNVDDIDFLVTVLEERKRLTNFIEATLDDELEERDKIISEINKLETVWNSYSGTLRDFATYFVRNKEIQ
jgi:hypothetical protein